MQNKIKEFRFLDWLCLLILSALCVALLEILHLPAALLLGPMAAAIGLALLGLQKEAPPPATQTAQGLVGLMIGGGIPVGLLGEIANFWPIVLAGTAGTLVISTAIAYLQARRKRLSPATAMWGFSAGAASVMTFMSKDGGADFRLVAVIQYMRVVCVAVSAGIAVSVLAPIHAEVARPAWFQATSPAMLVFLVVASTGGASLGARIRLAGGTFLLPMALGLLVSQGFGMAILVPDWMKAIAFGLIGWAIGLRFTPDLIRYSARALPSILGATAAMIIANGMLAGLLAWVSGIDMLTMFLATAPGGADSVSIIAASAPVDMGFVAMMQSVRLVVVLALAPILARHLVQRLT